MITLIPRFVEKTFRDCWRDGSSAIVLEPRELLTRLAAQVPPAAHQVRYQACLHPLRQGALTPASETPEGSGSSKVPQWKRTAWSELLRRVFAVDALERDRCGVRMRVMAAIRSTQAVSRFLEAVAAGRSPPMSEAAGRISGIAQTNVITLVPRCPSLLRVETGVVAFLKVGEDGVAYFRIVGFPRALHLRARTNRDASLFSACVGGRGNGLPVGERGARGDE